MFRLVSVLPGTWPRPWKEAGVGKLVSYRFEDPIGTITMDDGKVNAMSPRMLTELNAAFDQAGADRAIVLLSGREGVLSAGFDLPLLRAGGSESMAMVRAGFELAERMLSFPRPVVIACTGHAVAMGAFLLLSGDYRVGATGPYKFTANEVAIGLAVPRAGVEILRQRLAPAHFNRAVGLAEPFSPDNAVEAGFLDQVVEPERLQNVARGTAEALAGLDMDAHATSKLRARQSTLDAIRAGIDADHLAFRARA
jgi:enoyl-CoA hydratase